MVNKCPIDGNAEDIDQSKFWSPSGLNWDEHRIGWAIAGGCAVIVRWLSQALLWRPVSYL
jgi:hypothetical protein